MTVSKQVPRRKRWGPRGFCVRSFSIVHFYKYKRKQSKHCYAWGGGEGGTRKDSDRGTRVIFLGLKFDKMLFLGLLKISVMFLGLKK